MEKNTYATSAYIATTPIKAFEYLCELENLNQWTLGSRMLEKIDENTWLGTASGYQRNLYYHIRKIGNPNFYGIEWHCGFEYGKYFQIYPVLLFPPNYIQPNSEESGIYFHWLSFINPELRTPMIMEGIHLVHTAECRSLKAILERQAGYDRSQHGNYRLQTSTIYIDAPLELAVDYLGDLRNLGEWGFFIHPQGEINADSGEFIDEYGQTVQVKLQTLPLNNYYLIELDFFYPHFNFIQRSPMLLMPCTYAFGDSSASGFIQHRITFWNNKENPQRGKLQIEDYGAESMSIKRLLEKKAGNLDAFGKGMSYSGSQISEIQT
jgi:hypothetical protein